MNTDAKLFAALSSVILIAAIGLGSRVFATEEPQSRQVHVRYADVHLDNDTAVADAV